MIFVGVDWAEAHNDVLVMDQAGTVLGRGRFGVGVSGLAALHALIADHAEDPDQVSVGLEIDRGLLVNSLAGAGYGSTASTRWRPAAIASATRPQGPSPMPETPSCWPTWCAPTRTTIGPWPATAIRRAPSGCWRGPIRAWSGPPAPGQRLRSALRDYFPARPGGLRHRPGRIRCPGGARHRPDARAGRGLSRSKIAAALARGGRLRNLEGRAAEIQQALRAEQPGGGPAPWPMPSGPPARPAPPCSCRSTPRSPRSSASLPSVLMLTRTPRSCAVLPDSARSSAPGCSASSGMTRSLRRC